MAARFSILPPCPRLSAEECKNLFKENKARQEKDAKRLRGAAQRVWLRDPQFLRLRDLAFSLGVSKIVFAQRAQINNTQGQYLWNMNLDTIDSVFDEWVLSTWQRIIIKAALRKHKAVIILSTCADDACEILAHEIGHHIYIYLAGHRLETGQAAPTNAGRSDSRVDDYCREINDEFYAESFMLYLTGKPMRRIDLRWVLRRVCMNDTRAFSFLRQFRLAAA